VQDVYEDQEDGTLFSFQRTFQQISS